MALFIFSLIMLKCVTLMTMSKKLSRNSAFVRMIKMQLW